MHTIHEFSPDLRARLDGRLVVASLSGGKDSTAMALWLREHQVPHVRVFADTGFEAPETYAYLDVLRDRLGPVTTVRNEALWQGALPGEEGMLTLIRRKQMFPSRLMRFCTQKLKLHPIRDHVQALTERGEDVVNAVGVRAAESVARARMPEWEFWEEMDVDIWRPLLRWSEQDVIDIHRRHDLPPNPLYLAGARRVGCNPCIHARRSDLRLIPAEQLTRIRRVEDELTADAVARGCERPTRAFFQIRGEDRRLRFAPIDEVVRLAEARPVESAPAPAACVRWGLCDAPPEADTADKPLPAADTASCSPPEVDPTSTPPPAAPAVIKHAELERLGVAAATIAGYVADAILRPAAAGIYERTPELDRRLSERCNVGRGWLLAVGVSPATIATWLRRKVLLRSGVRGFYMLSRAAFESVRAAASGPGLPRELRNLPSEEAAPSPSQDAHAAAIIHPAATRADVPDAASAVAPEPPIEVPSAESPPPATRPRVVPCTISRARDFVTKHHRHLPPPVSGLFAVGLACGDDLIGVAIVGRPVSRALQDGRTAEVTRVCTRGERNACSMLLAACRRGAHALGYGRLVTYTLASEPGTSLRAAGWQQTAQVRGRSWHCPSRPRGPTSREDKRRWEAPAAA